MRRPPRVSIHPTARCNYWSRHRLSGQVFGHNSIRRPSMHLGQFLLPLFFSTRSEINIADLACPHLHTCSLTLGRKGFSKQRRIGQQLAWLCSFRPIQPNHYPITDSAATVGASMTSCMQIGDPAPVYMLPGGTGPLLLSGPKRGANCSLTHAAHSDPNHALILFPCATT